MDANGGGTLPVPAANAFVDVVVGLVGVSAVAGAGVGALIGRSRRAAATTMLAAVALAIGPGHNIPLLGGTMADREELGILFAIVIVSAVVLVETEVLLGRRLARPCSTPFDQDHPDQAGDEADHRRRVRGASADHEGPEHDGEGARPCKPRSL